MEKSVIKVTRIKIVNCEGHKSLDNTMKYAQLIGFKDDEFSARVAHCEDEACQLIETGYE